MMSKKGIRIDSHASHQIRGWPDVFAEFVAPLLSDWRSDLRDEKFTWPGLTSDALEKGADLTLSAPMRLR